MTDRTGSAGAAARRPSRRRAAALATVVTTLLLGLTGQFAGESAAAGESEAAPDAHAGDPFAGAAFRVDPAKATTKAADGVARAWTGSAVPAGAVPEPVRGTPPA